MEGMQHMDCGGRWFRGQLHAHSYWSDGRGFMEQTVNAYKRLGFHFLAFTEHNRFADDPAMWRKVCAEEGPWPPEITTGTHAHYVGESGPDWVETKDQGGEKWVRLKTFGEVKAHCEEPGRFILLPGVEGTHCLGETHVHLNYINIPGLLHPARDTGLVDKPSQPQLAKEMIAVYHQACTAAGRKYRTPWILNVNHPFWTNYDLRPADLIENPEILFFEICNGGDGALFPPPIPASDYTPGKFWDVVNAFRAREGLPLLYATAGDDSHFPVGERRFGESGIGDAWVVVHAKDLTPSHLVEAMRRGNFYATCGVELRTVAFDALTKTLNVDVMPEVNVNHRIHFITTKRGFDPSMTPIPCQVPPGRPPGTIPLYSSDIGRVVETVCGTTASYQMRADDLYVRAVVESDKPSQVAKNGHPPTMTAWTQPFTATGNGRILTENA